MTIAVLQQHQRTTVRELTATSSSSIPKQLPRRRLPLTKHPRHNNRKSADQSKLLGHLKNKYSRRRPRRSLVVPRVGMAQALRHTVDLCSDDSDCDDEGKHVSFAKCCTIVEIPHYKEYTDEQREKLWNGRKKIRSMARKNALEYQYDGWNLEAAAEEDQFIMVAGERVHPSHAPVAQAE